MANVHKVLIPKGMINPNETTVIEIPSDLKDSPMVVATQPKKKGGRYERYIPELDHSSSFNIDPRRQIKVVKKRSHLRRTLPKVNPPRDQNFAGSTTFGGMPHEESSEDSHSFYMYMPRDPAWKYRSNMDQRLEKDPVQYNRFNPKHESTLQGLDDSREMLYRSFRPPAASSRGGHASPGSRGKSMKEYQSSQSGQSGESSSGTYMTYYLPETSSSSGAHVYSDQSYPSNYVPGMYGKVKQVSSRTESRSAEGESSQEYSLRYEYPSPEQEHSRDASAEMSREVSRSPCTPPSPCSPPSHSSSPRTPHSQGSGNMNMSELLSSMNSLEVCEQRRIIGDLGTYQAARRQLIFDASTLATAGDISSEVISQSRGKGRTGCRSSM